MVLFRGTLEGIELLEWGEILNILSTISFTHSQDTLSWQWKASGKFTTQSLYKFLNCRWALPILPLLWWTLPVPPKI